MDEKLDLAKIAEKIGTVKKVGKERVMIIGKDKATKWVLKRFLPTKTVARIMGLWIGDGDKVRSIGITNTNLEIVKSFLDFLDFLDIPREKLRIEITIPKSLEDQKDKILTKTLNSLGLSSLKKLSTRISTLARKPAVRIRCFSRILSNLFHQIFEEITRINNQELKVEFLKGLLAAEGCVERLKNGKIHRVLISIKDKQLREIIKTSFLLPVGIVPSKDDKDSIRICGKSNFEIIEKFELLSLHNEKLKKFKSSFVKNNSTHAKPSQCAHARGGDPECPGSARAFAHC